MNGFLSCIFTFFLLTACTPEKNMAPNYTASPANGAAGSSATRDSLSYLALGDSYTIGTSVKPEENFPAQLVAALNQTRYKTKPALIIARNGWTTTDLSDALDLEKPGSSYDFVTLLIGVNNQYRGYPSADYKREFIALLKKAIGYAGGKADHVIVLSIPDYSVTPFAQGADQGRIRHEINIFNLINETQTRAQGAIYLNITDISRQAATNPQLIAGDGLHPSAEMYRRWSDLITVQIFQHL